MEARTSGLEGLLLQASKRSRLWANARLSNCFKRGNSHPLLHLEMQSSDCEVCGMPIGNNSNQDKAAAPCLAQLSRLHYPPLVSARSRPSAATHLAPFRCRQPHCLSCRQASSSFLSGSTNMEIRNPHTNPRPLFPVSRTPQCQYNRKVRNDNYVYLQALVSPQYWQTSCPQQFCFQGSSCSL